jgi:hypothetical protein
MKRIILLVITSLILVSCEDLLLESPKSLAVETFYNTNKEVEAAIGAIYSPLRSSNCLGGLYPAQLEAYTDYSYGRGSYGPLSNFQGLDGNNTPRAENMWNNFYLSIRNANIVIQNVPNGKKISDANKAKYTAEAKFLRALNYFFLVRNWSGVPIRTEENMSEIEIKRNTADEVYQRIYEDLTFAEENLPDNAQLPGKPSKWAAKTLLADVYFYQGKNSEARNKANEVIQSNKYSLVTVATADDFTKIYGPDVVTTTEEVFYVKFSRLGTNEGWNFVLFVHHPGSGYHKSGGYYAHYSDLVSNSVIANWDKNDLRFGLWYKYNIGLGANSILSKKFVDRDATGGTGAGNDFPLYRYADVLLLYAEADCRASEAPSADAMEKLNMVHRRAYGKNPMVASEVDFKLADYNKVSFIELVLKERGYETQMEAKRWLDLKRTGEVKQRIKAATGKDVADKHLLWPIPISELNYNSAIDPSADQNPGY